MLNFQVGGRDINDSYAAVGSYEPKLGSSSGSGGVKKEEPGAGIQFENRMKVEENFLVEDVKEEESPVYIKLKLETKEIADDQFKQSEQSAYIDTKEAKVLKTIFDPNEKSESNE